MTFAGSSPLSPATQSGLREALQWLGRPLCERSSQQCQ